MVVSISSLPPTVGTVALTKNELGEPLITPGAMYEQQLAQESEL